MEMKSVKIYFALSSQKQLIVKHGYPLEIHVVKTEDGYLLKMFRIASSRDNPKIGKRPPVLLITGLLSNTASWLLMGPKSGLAFLLVDNGYDVWLGNPRGSTWSRKHESLKSKRDKRDFWDFSFEQIGYYDIPALIDYILSITNQEKLFYVGHAQGSTSFFAMASARPEYNNNVQLMVAFSPFAIGGHAKSPIVHFFTIYSKEIQSIIDNYELYEFMPLPPLITVILQLLCRDGSLFQKICLNGYYLLAGSTEHFNKSMLPEISNNMPAWTSFKYHQHSAQLFASRRFQRYDYGGVVNIVKYNQTTPPEYDLSKVLAPVALYYGGNDIFNSEIDVELAASKMRNVIAKRFIRSFNHMDFIWAVDVVPLLYNDVLKLMKKF